jgi:hypothetical protein
MVWCYVAVMLVIDTGYSSPSATASSFIHLFLSAMYLAKLPLIRIIAHLFLHSVPKTRSHCAASSLASLKAINWPITYFLDFLITIPHWDGFEMCGLLLSLLWLSWVWLVGVREGERG